MTSYSSTITFNGHTLYIESLNVDKVQGTKKQVMGKTIVEIAIPGLNTYQNQISINGTMFDTTVTADTQRSNLLADQDGEYHAYVDGLHDGNYHIMSLSFDDTGDKTNHYTYSLTLKQH